MSCISYIDHVCNTFYGALISFFLKLKSLILIYCYCMEKSSQHILQNFSFCVPQKKQNHTGLEQHKHE